MKSVSRKLLSSLFFLLLALLFFIIAVSSVNDARSTCNGSIAECSQDFETLMDSEISRRFLAEKRYISNGALRRDEPACNGGGRGEPYSSSEGCLPPQSNRYNRGCSAYYKCRQNA
ncbi:protein RALF-like 32 [Coffea arabica]|uniref:Protein RALF-like 32 n=1 Tax=Coffea arabica TaxID=13443 RepID=A0A6P6WVM8_COFAR